MGVAQLVMPRPPRPPQQCITSYLNYYLWYKLSIFLYLDQIEIAIGTIYYQNTRPYLLFTKIVFVLFSHNFPPFLGKFGPLGETYDESEALGEPLALDLRTAEE